MGNEKIADAEVRECLRTVGVESQCQWDLLIFLHRHRTTLMTPERLATLMGYGFETVVTALDSLEALQLLQCVESYRARLYELSLPAAPLRRAALERLLALSDLREGRLAVWKHLRRDRSPREGLEAARRFVAEARQVVKLAEYRAREMKITMQRMQQDLARKDVRATGGREKGPQST